MSLAQEVFDKILYVEQTYLDNIEKWVEEFLALNDDWPLDEATQQVITEETNFDRMGVLLEYGLWDLPDDWEPCMPTDPKDYPDMLDEVREKISDEELLEILQETPDKVLEKILKDGRMTYF